MRKCKLHPTRVAKTCLAGCAFAILYVWITMIKLQQPNPRGQKPSGMVDYLLFVEKEEPNFKKIGNTQRFTNYGKTTTSSNVADSADYSRERIWFDPTADWDDRIVAQLRYKLPNPERQRHIKKIAGPRFLVGGKNPGREYFLKENCNVDLCEFVSSPSGADVVIETTGSNRLKSLSAHQIRLLYLLESPHHTSSIHMDIRPHAFNWTATYRHDSTIVAPYEKFVPFDNSVLRKTQDKNYARNKTKKVAWFVSNCNARNKRLEYAKQLGKYIDVDIYGNCGPHKCPRHSRGDTCFKMLSAEYKFYLSFENSNCRDYITEKLFWNGFLNDILPIVMGAHPDYYRRVSPSHSFIHVDDFDSPKKLADYLHHLDQHDEEYNRYFEWKGTGEFINTKFLCRVCAMAHAADETQHIESIQDIKKWWNGPGVCINGKWPTANSSKKPKY